MTFAANEFAEMMLETVVISNQSSLDAYGKQSWGAGVSYRCRIMNTQRILRDVDGREIVEAGRAIIYGMAPTVTTKSKIVLPNGSSPPVVSVSKIQDETGDHHTVVGFGQ